METFNKFAFLLAYGLKVICESDIIDGVLIQLVFILPILIVFSLIL